jgi:hypothetical protein
LTVLDHFTKFLFSKAFVTKEALPIAKWLLKTFMDNICMPERWHADNGGEFKNYHIDAVRTLLAANCQLKDGMLLPYSHSMPRNPQCQGLVERGNRTVKTTILKHMERDGFDIKEDLTWEWVPYMKNFNRQLNRKVVKMYGFNPCIMMTGQPPEAPDHISLAPDEARRLHIFCADQMKRQGDKMADEVFCGTFNKGDVVLVHQIAKRSHKDLRGKGGKSYTARAVVVKRSKTNDTHYKLRWITDGLANNDKAGDESSRMWPAWRLKLAVATAEVNGINLHKDADQVIVDAVMNEVSDEDLSSDNDSEQGPPLKDHEQIAAIADRYGCVCVSTGVCASVCVFFVGQYKQHNPLRMRKDVNAQRMAAKRARDKAAREGTPMSDSSSADENPSDDHTMSAVDEPPTPPKTPKVRKNTR